MTQPDCEEANRLLVGRRGNLIHPLRHSEERIMRRENLILLSIYKEKMRSSRGKAPLRMTPVVSDEILTPSLNEGSG